MLFVFTLDIENDHAIDSDSDHAIDSDHDIEPECDHEFDSPHDSDTVRAHWAGKLYGIIRHTPTPTTAPSQTSTTQTQTQTQTTTQTSTKPQNTIPTKPPTTRQASYTGSFGTPVHSHPRTERLFSDLVALRRDGHAHLRVVLVSHAV